MKLRGIPRERPPGTMRKVKQFIGPRFSLAGLLLAGGPGVASALPQVATQHAPPPSRETAPAWTVGFGKEFWRLRRAETASTNSHFGASQTPAPIDFGDVIERVSHAWAVRPTGAPPQVRARTYVASIHGTELRFSLLHSAPASDPPAEAVFRTLALRRGTRVLYAADGVTPAESLAGNTAQALLAPDLGLVQHCEARAAGVSVTWIVGSPLPGTGPLVVEMEWSGLVHTGQGPDGHHFADTRGTARWRFSNVTVVDSAGRRWAAETRAEAGRLRLEVPTAALTEAAYPLAIDPLLSPEFVMATPGLIPTYGISPALAAGAGEYLVVWEDYRNSEPAVSRADIYGARVSTNGVLLDLSGFPICTATNNQTAPAVAANGTGYLVAWEDQRDGPATNIYGARVSGAGVLLDTNGLAISTAANIQSRPAVAARGSNYLVVWEDHRSGSASDIYGARVTSAGVVAEPQGIPISTAVNEQAGPAVAGNGTNWLVVWHDLRGGVHYNIYGARVTAGGTVIEAGGFPITSDTEGHAFPAVASNGTNYFVVWSDGRGGFNASDIYGSRVTGAGVVSDPAGIAISTAPQTQYYPAVAYTQNRYLVAWTDFRNGNGGNGYASDVYATSVNEAGVVGNPGGIPVSTNDSVSEGEAKVAAQGGNFLLLWRGSAGVVFGTRANTSGVLLDPDGFAITYGPGEQWRPVVAWNGSVYLVVWEEMRDNVWLWGTRVTRAGIVMDPSGLAISPPLIPAGYPALAANGGNFLVLWGGAGARVTGGGLVVPLSGLPVPLPWSQQQGPLALAANGSGYLAAWTDGRNATTNGLDIYAARITDTGDVVDPAGFAVCMVTNDQSAPSVAANGSDWLVTWQDQRYRALSNGFFYPDVYAARVTAAGQLAEPDGFRISWFGTSYRYTAVAANGTDWLVVWADGRALGSGPGIYGARVSRAGVVAEPNGFAIAAARQAGFLAYANPVAAANGSDFLVLWVDNRNSPVGLSTEVYGARVTGAGCVLDPDGLPVGIKNGWYTDQHPKVASDGAGQYLVVSQSLRDNTGRAVGNFVDVRPVLRGITLAGGVVTLTWSTEASATYRVQVTTDLPATNWSDLLTVTNTVPSTNFVDTDATNFNRRFYRVISP